MRAVQLSGFEKPWELVELPDPEPAPGQVRIRVEASGLCGTDVHVHRGTFPVKPPCVIGHEPVGVVESVGAGVTAIEPGDRVGVPWFQRGCGRCGACQRGEPTLCPEAATWMTVGGGNAEHMLAWEAGCVLVPEGLAAAEAAPLLCAGYTVMSGLRDAQPQPGERVAVLGIGGLGHLAIQVAKALGHEVVAVTGTEGKRADALELGADEVVVAGDHAGRALAGSGGADIVLSCSNSARHVSQVLKGLRARGRLVNLGALEEPLRLSAGDLMNPPRRVHGTIHGSRRDLVDVLDLAAAGRVRAVVETHPLADANTALERLIEGKVRYRAVLEP